MIKCDFCVQSYYDKDGKVRASSGCSVTWCQNAIKTMSEVMKEEYRSKNSTNINKNYNYNKNKNTK